MDDLKKTILYQKHLDNGAKMVEFGGFIMPIEYIGITPEHQAVRNDVGLFDVSHMGEIFVQGKDCMAYLNYLLTNTFSEAANNKMIYSLMLYPNGGVVDDLMIYKFNNEFVLIVCNASNTTKDYEWMLSHVSGFEVKVENKSDEFGQLALQGPKAINIMTEICEDKIKDLKLFEFGEIICNGKKMLISRSGYTGEDGFEIYGSEADIIALFDLFVKKYYVQLCGLGCRDTLRFEAAMPLYGHEISQDINPVEACLNYAINYDSDFIGRDSLLEAKKDLKKKLVGIELVDRGIARNGYELCDLKTLENIGYITTGYLVPVTSSSLVDKPIALGYVLKGYWEIGTKIGIKIRNKVCEAVVRDKKFMTKKYVK